MGDRRLAAAGTSRAPADRVRRLAVLTDVVLALVVLGLGVARELQRLPGIRDPQRAAPAPYLLDLPTGWLVSAHVLGALLLLARRHRPYVVGLALAVLAVAVPVLAAPAMAYSVARYGRRLRDVLLVNAAIVAGLLTGGRLWELVGSADWQQGDPYTLGLLVSGLTATGLYVRTRGELLADLADRAERAEREGVLLAEQARSRERAGLAVELHDVVTHWVTLMTLQSAALSVSDVDDRARREADEVRQTGTRALHELHQLIRVLTSDDEPADGRPARAGLASGEPVSLTKGRPVALARSDDTVRTVVGEHAAGRRVALSEHGDPATVDDALHEVLRHAVGELLVNAGKHAPGAAVAVDVDYRDGGVIATVVNGPGDPTTGPPVGSGLGLATVQQRCSDLGGQLVTSVTVRGGFRAEVHLPAGPASGPATGPISGTATGTADVSVGSRTTAT